MKSLENLPSRAAIEAELERRARHKISQFYPDTGDLRRELYAKHLSFFRAGKEHRERLMLAGNRSGKSTVGAYELTCHLTGQYPPAWWKGRRFDKPIKAWACGESGKKVREVVQEKLFGPSNAIGTGMIPGEYITSRNMKAGVPDAIDTAWIQHISGGHSLLTLKSYEQRREGFDGDAIEVIWLDEEATVPIYIECLLRTLTTSGLVMLTFTPLQGLSELVQLFLPGGSLDQVPKNKFVVSCEWSEVPHLDESAKKELWDSIPPYQRDARSKGIPQLGSGAIYPVPESDVVVSDFEIPDHWLRAYALDVGWNKTAAIWGAQDLETSTIYLYSEYYRSQAEPVIHAEAIKARGAWIPGVIDPAARGRSQRDGSRLIQCYLDLGLDLQFSENAVEAGLYEVWQLLSSGKLKVFESCQHWREEFRLYRRNEDGKIVKERDHLQDCVRYLILSGRDRMRALPVKQKPEREFRYVDPTGSWLGWMR